MQNYSKMDKYYQSYINNNNQNGSSILKFSSLFVILSGLLLAIILMAVINITDKHSVTSTHNSLPIVISDSDDSAPIQSVIVHDSADESMIENNIIPVPKWQSVSITSGDTLISLLSDLNINAQDSFDLIAIPEVKKTLSHLRVGDNLQIQIDDNNHLTALRYPLSNDEVLTVQEKNNQYKATIDHLKTNVKDIYTNAVINESLYTAAHRAGLSTKTIMQFISIFSSKINFAKDIHKGDSFQIIYQDKYNKKHDLGAGDILAARLYVGDKSYTAIGFDNDNNVIDYYTPEGSSLKSDFLRAPVHYTRISDPFTLHRYHPILRINRPHEGVDLAAPRGTPVKAAADGKIIYMGKDGGYGNLVKISHGHGVTTRYAHLSRYAKGLHVGSYVHEGQRIAYVGSSGLATGPHLHFEVRINNQPHNPLTVALPSFGKALPVKDKTKFFAEADKLMAELNPI